MQPAHAAGVASVGELSLECRGSFAAGCARRRARRGGGSTAALCHRCALPPLRFGCSSVVAGGTSALVCARRRRVLVAQRFVLVPRRTEPTRPSAVAAGCAGRAQRPRRREGEGALAKNARATRERERERERREQSRAETDGDGACARTRSELLRVGWLGLGALASARTGLCCTGGTPAWPCRLAVSRHTRRTRTCGTSCVRGGSGRCMHATPFSRDGSLTLARPRHVPQPCAGGRATRRPRSARRALSSRDQPPHPP